MYWQFLALLFLTACRDPYVIDAKGIEIEKTCNKYHEDSPEHESFDDSEVDEYLTKPMVHEVDVVGVDTTDPQDKDRYWLDWPDAYDKSLFRSPAMSTMPEDEYDALPRDELRDFEGY